MGSIPLNAPKHGCKNIDEDLMTFCNWDICMDCVNKARPAPTTKRIPRTPSPTRVNNDNHLKEPNYFPMKRGGVPDQIKYLERHGLTLTRPLHDGKYHAMSCGATYLCELCMEVDVSPNLPNILKRIPSEEAKEITDYYNFLKAAGNEPRGRLVKAVYAGLCEIVNTCSVNHPKEPKFFPMNRGGDRSIVPDQIKYLERHGLTLTVLCMAVNIMQ